MKMNELNRQPEYASRPTKETRFLRRFLSPHELATLLLLLSAPIEMNAKPEISTLQEAGLVEKVCGVHNPPCFQLTSEGNALLRGLGAV
jgi:hypothetical protein